MPSRTIIAGHKRNRNGRVKNRPHGTRPSNDRAESDDDGDDGIIAGQVLPVAVLPDDFDGEAIDGATFLALANRSNATLPFATRAILPDHIQNQAQSQSFSSHFTTQPTASSSRHPALPNSSWAEGFANHFIKCREELASRWPPDPLLPYPAHLPPRPALNVRGSVWLYINGHKRKWRIIDEESKVENNQTESTKSKEEEVEVELELQPDQTRTNMDKGLSEEDLMNDITNNEKISVEIEIDKDEEYDEDEEWGLNGNEGGSIDEVASSNQDRAKEPQLEDMEMDEEEAMNMAESAKSRISKVEGEIIQVTRKPPLKELEEEEEKHRPHEPLVSVMQRYNSNELIHLIAQLSTFISESLELLTPFVLIPTPADDYTDENHGKEIPATTRIIGSNPFPERYMKWIYVSLLLIDSQLDGDQISTLRDLARVVMRVAGWRWIRGVTDGEVDVSESIDTTGIDWGLKIKEGWKLGKKWKDIQDQNRNQNQSGNSCNDDNDDNDNDNRNGEIRKSFKEIQVESGLDETLARCWIVVYAIVGVWGQKDLLEELQQMYQ